MILKNKGIKNGLMKKGCYRRKLTAEEILKNKLISKRRSAVIGYLVMLIQKSAISAC
jgi:hypothetical protein